MERQSISFTLGERLKNLREARGLSHEKLKAQLEEKYGITISRDSLMAYEISDELRAKASKLPNLGMRVEYLYCLADFYGVSLDYLFGKTNIPALDINIRQICEYTGLPEDSIIWLNEKTKYHEFNVMASVIHKMLDQNFEPSLFCNSAMLMASRIRACFQKNLKKQTRKEAHKETDQAMQRNFHRIQRGEFLIEIPLGEAMEMYEKNAVYYFGKILREVMITEAFHWEEN